MTGRSLVGTEAVLDVGPVAHGGHCVARLDGRVVFVRHVIPGERVLVRVTEGGEDSRFLRADAVEVEAASPDRVTPPCPYAGPGRCGGCDFQHVTPAHQRELKAAVVREQFQRLARLDLDELFPGFEVEPLPGRPDGLRWRTRVEFAAGEDGLLGLRQHRSHDVVVLDDCLIADERVIASRVLARSWLGHDGVDVVAADAPARPVVVTLPERGRTPTVHQWVEVPGWSGDFQVGARGFWQVHPSAAPAFVEHVMTLLSPRPGEDCLDLYAGVGLFAVALADAVGPAGSVLAVEGFRPAVVDGLANAAGRPQVEFRHGRVEQVMHGVVRRQGRSDLVVLDPPRTGAGRSVVEDVVATGPRAVAYVACDPAALARDTAYLHEAGYRLTSVRAFDAFPMTHHVECIAGFVPA